VAYLTDEISEGATRRRLDEITTAGMRAFDERVERAAQIDEEFRQAQAKMKDQVKAMDQLVADSHAEREADADKDDQTGPNQWATRESKPTVLSLGGEELVEDTSTAQPMPSVPPAPPAAPPVPPPPPPPPPPEPAPAAKMLSLGFEEDEPEPPAPAQPMPTGRHAAVRLAAPEEDDDDLSDVNWMR